ncbi:MAG: glycoside hydrolase family 127 protein [Victivallales bacterium]|nr:glycoside hydrolase family 127 protein [Victivallales bacterium]
MQIRQPVVRLKPGQYRQGGKIAERMETFFRERVFSDFAKTEILGEAEEAFRTKKDDETGVVGVWQGEFWGKWIISAVRAAEYEQDSEMLEFLRQAALRLLALQQPDGYLGTYRNPDFVLEADPVKSEPVMGYPCKWNWNIWCRKYTFWGLLEVFRATGDQQILAGARKMADFLIAQLQRLGLKLRETGTFKGAASGSTLKPILQLFQYTQDKKYLDFATDIVNEWRRKDNACPNLIVNALSGRPVHTWYPEPETWAKAYETMSCFDGLVEYWKVTGDAEVLHACEMFHNELRAHELNPMFSVGLNDIFKHASIQLNAISEPCDAIHWMRLCSELFYATGKYQYLDDLERTYYNAFLAAACFDGKWGARGVRSHTRHLFASLQAQMKYHHCCVNNMPRGFLNAAESFVTLDTDAVSVNLYTDFQAEFPFKENQVRVRIDGTEYLPRGEASITVRCSASLPLRLRIPGWATAARLTTPVGTIEGTGDHFALMLQPGETTLRVSFARTLEIHNRMPVEESVDWCRRRWIGRGVTDAQFRQEPGSWLIYGPLLLARSVLQGNTPDEIFRTPPLPFGFGAAIQPLDNQAPPEHALASFQLTLLSPDGTTSQTRVCDYASAGNVFTGDAPDIEIFSIFF